MRQVKSLVLALFSVAVALSPMISDAGSIMITSGPTVNFSGVNDLTVGGAQNAVVLTTPAPNLVKIYTTTDLVFQLTSTTGMITLNIEGTVSGEIGEMASGTYDVFFSLTGTGSFDINGGGSVDLGFPFGVIPFNFQDTGIMGPLTNQNFTGGETTDPSPFTLSDAPFTGFFNVSWTGTVGDQMTISVPQNSIDFGIIPEPGSLFGLATAGICFLVARRRRCVVS